MISISIVSHQQMSLVVNLLDDIKLFCDAKSAEVVLTINAEEDVPIFRYDFPIRLVKNTMPKGFGANHNQAFKLSKGDVFCVMNPDIRLVNNPFPELEACLDDLAVGVVAPVVFDSVGARDDSARVFPSPFSVFLKFILTIFGSSNLYKKMNNQRYEWVGGMFMLFRKDIYQQFEGFDEKFFLYYEDVDICARLTNEGKRIVLCANAQVIHLAQRTSHRNLKYLRWHITSMLRFFLSKAYWRLLWR